ncbi:transglutaminase family protein [uncultured Clostridium sp.]|uniref:transglutaminase-like domain-containing protein n=1 Tax=uncultured Clostridium sp. TaxID=59620 RepID=UPI002630A2B2|nr:transglutaminase-like domain-containing protein [uncultured Clostridium sp.]
MRASYLDILLVIIFLITLIGASVKKFSKQALLSDFLFGVRVILAYIGAVITYYIIQSSSIVDKGISILISYINIDMLSPSFTAYILTVAVYGISTYIIYLILNIFLGIFKKTILVKNLNNLEHKKFMKNGKRAGLSGILFNIPTGIAYCLIAASIFTLLIVRGIMPIKGESTFIAKVIENAKSVQVSSEANPFHDYEFAKPEANVSEETIIYYNGVTLDEAIKSDTAIKTKAIELTKSDSTDLEKARTLYNWVGNNIQYDDAKAEEITRDKGKGVTSGAIEAFNTRQGVCFDYASLYAAMAIDVGLRVRIISGEGYTGSSWGPHAWNEVYIPSEKKWIPVDTTFASTGDYFATTDFASTHRDDKVIGAW